MANAQDPTGREVPYRRLQATRALNEAMQDLADRLGKPIEEMENMTLGQAFALAEDMYPGQLPDFWRVWNDWQKARPAPMGEL
jgi:hypothetical protein